MNNIPEGKQFNLDDIFSNLPTETEAVVKVPSKSKFYNGAYIKIRPMTFEDEKAMILSKKNKTDARFKHHGNTTSQKLFIKIHHPNQHLDVDPTKPKQSKIEVAMKRKYRVKNVTCDIGVVT